MVRISVERLLFLPNSDARLMRKTLLPIDLDGTTVYVETDAPYGSEETGALDAVLPLAERSFDAAKVAITALANGLLSAVSNLRETAGAQELAVEFGIKFNAEGKVIIASVEGETSLNLKIVFKRAGAD